MRTTTSRKFIIPFNLNKKFITKNYCLLICIILTLFINNQHAFKLQKKTRKTGESISDTSKDYESQDTSKDSYSRETNQRNQPKNTQRDSKNTLKANEIRQESKNSLINCADVNVKEEYADCVIDNLSLEFFFTAFIYYKKRFKKSYRSVREENRRFQIFMKNYQLILK